LSAVLNLNCTISTYPTSFESSPHHTRLEHLPKLPPNPPIMILPRQNLSPSYPKQRHRGPSLHPAAIFGIAAGVILFLVITTWILIFCFCRKALKGRTFLRPFRGGAAGNGPHGAGYPHQMGHSNHGNGYYGHNNGDTAGQAGYGGGQYPGGMPSGYYQGQGHAGAGEGHNMNGGKVETGSGGHGIGGGHGDGGASGGGGGGGTTGGGMAGGN
ncbi:hypothetical protein QBC43DRAFT_360951, partial [Cladorrhinum sp. PSN259]